MGSGMTACSSSTSDYPKMDKDLKRHVLDAGFANVRVTASSSSHATPDDIAFIYGLTGWNV